MMCLLLPAGCSVIGETAAIEKHAAEAPAFIVCPGDATITSKLAARELQRYIYQRTDTLLPTADTILPHGDAIVIVVDDKLAPQQYTLKTRTENGRRIVRLVGGSEVAVLYAAYHFAETLGVRFYLHGDVIPDEKIAFALPELDESPRPLFKLRGLNPWGSHSEGMDLWNTDDWKQVFAQMAKLRMNFLGIHSYPENGGQYDSEATVWIGLPGDFDDQGRVNASSPASYFNTLRTQWGYIPRPTGEYRFGASLLFERDDWGSDVTLGQCPVPTTPQGSNAVFNRTGRMFGEAFAVARQLGIKTGIGTESPLRIPAPLKERLIKQGKNPDDPAVIREVYEGIFRRIAASHPLDYYWIWTPEDWLWAGNTGEQTESFLEDFKLAYQASKAVDAPFELATCGWVLGPIGDRSAWYRELPADVAVSALSEAYSGPVDPAFDKIKGREKWAIPWMEEDNGILGPQLWVSRIRKDAADALAYGCTGLMGLHWRTREIGPTVSALARAGWCQTAWNPEALKDSPGVPPSIYYEGPKPPFGRSRSQTTTIDKPIDGTEDDALYQNYRHTLLGYRLKVPNGHYRVTLKFCEPDQKADGKRVFKVRLQDKMVDEGLDIFARTGQLKALDLSFDNIEVDDGWLHVGLEPVKGGPCIAAIVIEGKSFTRKVNCGGAAYKGYEADPQLTKMFNWGPAGTAYEPRGLDCGDLYEDWASHSFGSQVGPRIAAIFTKLDGRVPLVSSFDGGAGALMPDARPWHVVAKEFGFLGELESLRSEVNGAGNRDRYEYWLNMFRHLKAQARVCCAWGRLEVATRRAGAEKDRAWRKHIIEDEALPIREEITRLTGRAFEPLLQMVSTPGSLATVINWEGHVYRNMVKRRDEALAKLYSQPLPVDGAQTPAFRGKPRLIVPTVRTMLREDEVLKLKVIVLDNDRPTDAALHWRTMGRGEYRRIELQHVARGVYTVQLPPAGGEAIEYYITATARSGQPLAWPATAPRLNQTIVVMPKQ